MDENSKQEQLDEVRENPAGKDLTSDHGVKISDTDNSLKAGERGPTIMEDFHFREKMTQFDHESIPERVVHARGTGAHGESRGCWVTETRKRDTADLHSL